MTCNNYSTPSLKDRASTSTYPHEVNKLPLVACRGLLLRYRWRSLRRASLVVNCQRTWCCSVLMACVARQTLWLRVM
jgi:hypothetical protein